MTATEAPAGTGAVVRALVLSWPVDSQLWCTGTAEPSPSERLSCGGTASETSGRSREHRVPRGLPRPIAGDFSDRREQPGDAIAGSESRQDIAPKSRAGYPARAVPTQPRIPMPGSLPPLIVIAGATATGKTCLSLELAEWIGDVEIVGADSRQVYRGMDVGTAKATPAERARVPHHGVDLADPDEAFTAADFRRHALTALTAIAARGRVALLVGGTGLYVRAVARGVVLESTGRDPALRAQLEARLAEEGPVALAADLRRIAPGVAGSIDLANPRRVVRALERVLVVGDRPPPAPVGYPAPVLWLGLAAEPAVHERLIVERAAWQFGNGLMEESATLLQRYPEDLRAFSAMGYREAFDVIAGRIDLPTAIERDARRTRAYAKRQRTWFRSEHGIHWLPAGPSAMKAARAPVKSFLGDLERPGSPVPARPYP